jgi:dienelactone hydrolase
MMSPAGGATGSYEVSSAYTETAVSVATSSGSSQGAFVSPNEGGSHPAILFVSGVRASDKDASMGASKPFRNLANGLAARGVASLRYDADPNANWRTTVDNALAALRTLRQQPNVDPRWVFVVGHGRGGSLAPEIAKRDGNVAGAILLAPERALNPDLVESELDRLGGRESSQRLLDALRARRLTADDFFRRLSPNLAAELKELNMAQTALGLSIPILVLHAGRDEISTREDIESWQDVLGRESRVAFYSHGRLNHAFTEADSPEEAAPVASQVLDDIALWLGETTGRDFIAAVTVMEDEPEPLFIEPLPEDDLSSIGVLEIGDGAPAPTTRGQGDEALSITIGEEPEDDFSLTIEEGEPEEDLEDIGVFEFE